MLDLDFIRRLHIRGERPGGQRFLANLLTLDYAKPPRTEVIIEGLDRLPQDRPVLIAMNHTDRYNCWPFQWRMHRLGLRYTATWVKGKYYENPLMAWFMAWTSNIPMPSRGYLLASTFRQRIGRKPTSEEYRQLREALDERPGGGLAAAAPGEDLARYLATWGGRDAFPAAAEAHWSAMIAEVMRLHAEALHEARRHVLIFPEGTRSPRLARGHTGIAQIAQHLGLAIVPVGCSGSTRLYPGNSPFSRGGRVVYRVGAPLELDGPDLAPYRVREPFQPFTADAARFGQRLQAITDVVMGRLHDLVDPEYGYAAGQAETATGVDRFL